MDEDFNELDEDFECFNGSEDEDESVKSPEPERDILDIIFDHTVEELDQETRKDKEDSFFALGCGCQKGCSMKFDREEVRASRLACMEMKYYCADHISHHHTFVMGPLNCLLRTSAETLKKTHKGHNRKFNFTCYKFRGVDVCLSFFMFVNDLGEREMKNLKRRLYVEGVTEQMHRNYRKSALNSSLPLESRERAVQFIQTYGIQHGLILPGRAPAFRRYVDLIILPSRLTKLSVYEKYKEACNHISSQPVMRSSWYTIWQEFCPNIVVQQPRTDLCTICQRSIVSSSRLQNMPEEVKKEKIQSSMHHLDLVSTERKHYYEVIQECRVHLQPVHIMDTTFARKPCTYDGPLHYSFDYAQQIFIPHSSQQVGPIYFLTPYKVGLFEVSIEPLNRFILYVIPEASTVGKGVNSVLSFVKHAMENFGVGETRAILHCDNCVGQNKNNVTMNFIALQALQHRYESIELHCLPVGHTKFEPNARFGNFKTRWNRHTADTVRDVCAIAAQSNSTTVVLVGNEIGEVYVPQYNWSEFFRETRRTKNIPNIRSMHHFRTTNEPGEIASRKTLRPCDEEQLTTVILPTTDGWPTEAKPVGLSEERQKYLYDVIREYVSEEFQDTVCPRPSSYCETRKRGRPMYSGF